MIVWLDGELTQFDEARIDPRDRAFTLGDALFETIRIKDGRPLRTRRHFDRLDSGLDLLGFPARADRAEISRAIGALLAANPGLPGDALVRLTMSRGRALRGLPPPPDPNPTLFMAAGPYVPPVPLKAIVATVTRRNEHSPLSRVKTTNCLDGILSRIEADRRGADEAILLNGAGRVAEASMANVFAVIDGTVATPPVEDGALPGVIRADLIERMGVVERPLWPADLARASEIFVSSALGIRPIVALDGQAVERGPAALRAAEIVEDA